MFPYLVLALSFLLVAFSARQIGQFARRLNLPLITGYMTAGILVGPFVLGWFSPEMVARLRPVDEAALAFIAFAAGGELYLKDLRARLKSILWITGASLVTTLAIGVGALLLLTGQLPFMAALSPAARVGVAFMAGAILLARSPSSAIAIVNELRARGPFTNTSLGVTMVMDGVVIVAFAISLSFARVLVADADFDGVVLLRIVVDLSVSLGLGYALGRGLSLIFGLRIPEAIKTALLLGLGYGVFAAVHPLAELSGEHGFEVGLEALLVCMVAGAVLVNSDQRDLFREALEKVAPAVYIAFFTLVGASLALDALVRLWPIALALFAIRLLGIASGAIAGGAIAGDPPPHRRYGWMTYITQAGVGLGLAKEVADEFPGFGAEFATLIIATIVISQVVGPPLIKLALKRVGEAHIPPESELDDIRNAVIFGIEYQSIALGVQLQLHNWQVVLVDPDPSHVERLANSPIAGQVFREDDAEQIARLFKGTDAVVAMLERDADNYRICELAYENFNVPRIIVRLNDRSWSEKFAAIGAAVVEPASAMVNVLDLFVRTPSAAALVLHTDPNFEIEQVTLLDPDVVGSQLRDLKLPVGIRVLEICRRGQTFVPQGYSTLELNDDLTLIGERSLLETVTARLGF